MLKEEEFDSTARIEIYREVIREVYTVSKLYKRKSKKSRNSSIQAPNNKTKPKKKVIVLPNKEITGYLSDSSSAFEEGELDQNSSPSMMVRQEKSSVGPIKIEAA